MLDQEFQLLLKHAREATQTAHAPYSNFRVGAALLLSSGKIVTGSNQENAAFNSGLCAERIAFFSTAAHHPGETIKKVAVVARKASQNADVEASPCGSCRQVMLEYEQKQKEPIKVVFNVDGKLVKSASVANLLPYHFNSNNLV